MPFSEKNSIHQLTFLMQDYGIRHVVACPGSRNAPILHNLQEAGFLLHPVTDERSAGFVALGLRLAEQASGAGPVAVCVTSGSALLATLPAVAEAYYRRSPLLIVSADRPLHRLGQLEGQMLPQEGALEPYARTYNLTEEKTDADTLANNRLLNEALSRLCAGPWGPVHINLRIEEPLFRFTRASLQPVRHISYAENPPVPGMSAETLRMISEARLPALVFGQWEAGELPEVTVLRQCNKMLVLPEVISGQDGSEMTAVFDLLLGRKSCPANLPVPDVVLHVGGNAVGKQIKLYLRRQKNLHVIRMDSTGEFIDTFDHLARVEKCDIREALPALAASLPVNPEVEAAHRRLNAAVRSIADYHPRTFSDFGVMQALAKHLADTPSILHTANSTSIRHAALLFSAGLHRIFANRGVNGIEGSLSTAVGHAMGSDEPVYVMIGDLSLFYDINALGISPLPPTLRIVLFNNHGGQIFHRLPGLEQSPALTQYIAGAHPHCARDIARGFGLRYFSAKRYDELQEGLAAMTTPPETESPAAMLLEVFTRPTDNEEERISLENWMETAYRATT